AAPEHERVAALEPDDGARAAPPVHEQPHRLRLRQLRAAASLAHVEQLGGDAGEAARRDEPVAEDHVRGREQLARPHREQAPAARPSSCAAGAAGWWPPASTAPAAAPVGPCTACRPWRRAGTTTAPASTSPLGGSSRSGRAAASTRTSTSPFARLRRRVSRFP